MRIYTYYDAVAELDRFVKGWSGPSANMDELRGTILTQLDGILNEHDWQCLYQSGRVVLKGCVQATATYDSATRTLTTSTAVLDTATMNDWSVWIDRTLCDIQSITNTTTAILDSVKCPAGDVASSAVVLFPQWTRLPDDFVAVGKILEHAYWRNLIEVSPAEILHFYVHAWQSGDPRYYAIGPIPDLYGAWGLFVYPVVSVTQETTFPYKRRMRDLRYSGHAPGDVAGTVSITGAAVTGLGTQFEAGMVGSFFRPGTSASAVPTGLEGKYPYPEQRVIASVESSVSLTLDAAVETNRGGVKYCITDPIDVDAELYRALVARCKAAIAIDKGRKEAPMFMAQAIEALRLAKVANNRTRDDAVAGFPVKPRPRVADLYRGSSSYRVS